jgi:hypothetical protein
MIIDNSESPSKFVADGYSDKEKRILEEAIWLKIKETVYGK